jgi:3-oxoadipate enol-lactonase
MRERSAALREVKGGLAQALKYAYSADFPRLDPLRHFLYQQISGLNLYLPANVIAVLMAVKHRIDAVVEKRVPTMLVVGEEDVLAPPKMMEQMARRIPHARLVKVPGAGHSVYFEKPEEFNQILLGFLRETIPDVG